MQGRSLSGPTGLLATRVFPSSIHLQLSYIRPSHWALAPWTTVPHSLHKHILVIALRSQVAPTWRGYICNVVHHLTYSTQLT